MEERIGNNQSMKVLEIRYLNLNRNALAAIFSSLVANSCLQMVTLSHGALNNALVEDYQVLAKSLKSNSTLLCLDLSYNSELDDNLEYH